MWGMPPVNGTVPKGAHVKGTGPGGLRTPLDGQIKDHQKKKQARSKKQVKGDIELSDALQRMRVTPKSLASGAYQQKMVAFFAQYITPEFFNAVRRGIRERDPQCLRLWAQMTNFIQSPQSGFNLTVNQTNQTANIRQAQDDGHIKSFEEITRMLQEKRQKLALLPSAEPVFEITPED